ncbi:MAG TPA: helix-turn-helix domain-containing protein [Promicromonospora sp.]|nr:helix-turn-helix domain-containing protein [Promicromonospora sp.]
MTSRARASRMSPEDRQAAIVEAVLPLVAERGHDVTSRELAQAAGVAEGTLFRAFGDKTALVGAVAVEGIDRAGRPEEALAELTAIDPGLPLERRLERVIELGRHRVAEIMRWMTVLRRMAPHHGPPGPSPGSTPATAARTSPPASTTDQHERLGAQRRAFVDQLTRQRAASAEGIAAVLAPDAHRLRVPVEVAVSLVEAAIAGAHLRIEQVQPVVPAAVLADALVNGLAEPEARTQDPGAPDPGTPKKPGTRAAQRASSTPAPEAADPSS